MRAIEENRARNIVVTEWVLLTLATLFLVIVGISYSEDIKAIFADDQAEAATYLKAALIIIIVYVVLSVILTAILTNGVHGAHPCSCKTWYIINIISAVLGVIGLAGSIISLDFVGVLIKLLALAYRVYAIKIIMAYTATLTSSAGVIYEQCVPAPSASVGVDPPAYYEIKKGNANMA